MVCLLEGTLAYRHVHYKLLPNRWILRTLCRSEAVDAHSTQTICRNGLQVRASRRVGRLVRELEALAMTFIITYLRAYGSYEEPKPRNWIERAWQWLVRVTESSAPDYLWLTEAARYDADVRSYKRQTMP